MKNTVKLIALLLCAALVTALCACSGGSGKDTVVGEYEAFGISVKAFGDYVVESGEEYRSVITLDADGTGYMTINDEGGDIEEWSLDGEDITIHSGVSVLTGTLKDGVLVLDSDDYIIYFAKEGTNTSSVKTITQDEFTQILEDSAANNAAVDPAGEYHAFAMANEGYPDYIVDIGENSSIITLNADGSGHMTAGEEIESDLTWSLDGDAITLTAGGEDMTGTYADGVIILHYADADMTAYYARENADTSAYKVISQDEMRKIIEEAMQ